MQTNMETLDRLARSVAALTILSKWHIQTKTIEVDGAEWHAELSKVEGAIQLKLNRYSAPRELTSEVYLINDNDNKGTMTGKGTVRTWTGEPHMDMETFEQSGPYRDTEYFPPARRADEVLQRWRQPWT